MSLLSYVLLVLAFGFAALLPVGIMAAALYVDWSHEVFSAAFWTGEPEHVRNAALVLGGIAAAVAAAIGLPLAAVRTVAADAQAQAANAQAQAANAQAQIAEQGHITDRFTKAIEQLGSDKLEVRLGAIYALERIARDSPRDHGPIMETLAAYVRERAAWKPASSGEQGPVNAAGAREPVKPPTDIQALLTVIGRRQREYDVQGQWLDLRATDLRGTDLAGAHLEGALLQGAHLEGAHLERTHLEGALLTEAHLERASLAHAHLEHAVLGRAHLGRAVLAGAHLDGALGLTQDQLDRAFIDERTELSDGLTTGPVLRARIGSAT